ncbi:MAG: DNA translocase FtsK 4TM domain-containing protein [Candidatus Paceibacterota bacterium]
MGRKKKIDKRPSFISELNESTRHMVSGTFFLLIAVILFLAPLEIAGVVGNKLFNWFTNLLGIGYFLLPATALFFSFAYFRALHTDLPKSRIVGIVLFFLSGLGLIARASENGSGLFGELLEKPLVSLFGNIPSTLILISLLFVSILITLNSELHFEKLLFWRKWFQKNQVDVDGISVVGLDPKEVEELSEEESEAEDEDDEEEDESEEVDEEEVTPRRQKKAKPEAESDDLVLSPHESYVGRPYSTPPLSLLAHDKGKPGVGDIKANANIIKRSLQNFGINVEMDEINIGPSVTRYSLKPAEGVKLSRIVGLQSDLSLALAAHPIRIEAPIPGKSLVGIEIPNSTKTKVGLGSLLASPDYQKSPKQLLVSLGKGISGAPHFANLAKMPHLLVAGATGAGKSVTIHNLLISLLYRNSPENMKLLMVDPKRVELTMYNKIPHLLTPVITDPRDCLKALKWAVNEMTRRYDILEAEQVRDIESYHENIRNPLLEKYKKAKEKYEGLSDAEKEESEEPQPPEMMPFVVFIIDELADIMQMYPRELEAGIVRLAQMSRAVGIHLILSTQRPSVNVITGLIKANVPARIALQVASQIDSRTILDSAGAEKLLGSGDMLYISGEMSKPQRIQASFISEEEVKEVVKYLKDAYLGELNTQIDLSEVKEKNLAFGAISDDDEKSEDPKYDEAKAIIFESGQASISYLQRRLGIGYSRSAKIIDQLEENGIIGPKNGSKPREIYRNEDDEAEEDSALGTESDESDEEYADEEDENNR